MGKRKELSKFSDLELICELRARGLAVTAYGPDDLEEVGVKPCNRKKVFAKIREDLEDHMSFEANLWLDITFEQHLKRMHEMVEKISNQA